jgi:G3E family GTPase
VKPIPVSVIGGYLGSGKTTLLNALLRAAHGVRFAVLVNDFGSVNVDAELVASSGTRTIELTNGCTCCTIGGDLILALRDTIARDDAPERIVIEASGVADPRAVARLAACHPALSLQGTVVVADAQTIRKRTDDKYVGGLVRRQLEAADAVVLSKVDLIDADRLAEVRQLIARTIPSVPVFESANGDGFPAEIAFDPHFVGGLRDEVAAQDNGGHAAFTAMTYFSTNPLDRTRFLNAIRAMIPTVARAKGTLYFSDEPEARCMFQLSGDRWSIEPFAPKQSVPRTQIVAIALAEREAYLKDAFEALGRAETRRTQTP